MTDDRAQRFEADLATVLREAAGPGAPASLRYRLAHVTDQPTAGRRAWSAPVFRWGTAAAALVALAVLAVTFGPNSNGPTTTGQQSALLGEPTPSGEPSPTSVAAPSQAPSPSAATSPTATTSPAATPSLAPSPASPTASPSAATSPTQPPVDWTHLTWSKAVPMPDGQFLSDVVPWGDGYVGVGGIDTGSGIDAGFYTSANGTSWKLVAREADKSGELARLLAADVVRIGNRLLAVGSPFMNGPGEPPTFPAPLWASGDGVRWSRVHDATWDAAFKAKWPGRLIAGPRGVVALTLGADPIVLRSPDGSSWKKVALPVTERAVASDAAEYPGGFVIVGRDGQPDVHTEVCDNTCPPPGVGRPAAWTSADGMHWSEATVEGDKVAGAGLSRVVADRAGLVALGSSGTADSGERRMASWISADGRSWSIAGGTPVASGTGPYPVLAGDGDQALVFDNGSGGSGLAAWATSDGATWTRLAFAAAENGPATGCRSSEPCMWVQQAWVLPDGIVVMGTPGPVTPQTLWRAAPGT